MRKARVVAPALATLAALSGCGAGVGARSVRVGGTGAPPASIRQVNEQGTVPWVDTPGHMFVPVRLPGPPPPPTNARPCTATDLSVSKAYNNGGGGHLDQYFELRNTSASTCILSGFPGVVATQAGRPDAVGTDGGFFVGHGDTPADMAPGGRTRLGIETNSDCSAFPGGRAGVPPYHSVVVTIPGGGKVTLHGSFAVVCGLFVGAFDVPQAPPRYSQPPLEGATARLELPSSVAAGTTLDYVVDLTNPTGRAMELNPCPSYQQGKALFQLDCANVHSLAPDHTVRYAMQQAIPAGTPTGPTDVYWSLAGALDIAASGSVEVHGRDTPCTSAQLTSAIAGPGRVPGPPNMLGEKGLATTVALRVTNRSGTACSVFGAPSVKVTSAGGTDLGLKQVDERYNDPIAPPSKLVTLAPRTGSATANLYWYLGRCGPNPNPVTVEVTLPANGATSTVKPAGGWRPPPCRAGEPGPGQLSADAFVAASTLAG
ncbi:MAG: DUF4232 domain-containing protein [Acidimicrobiales bacterium]